MAQGKLNVLKDMPHKVLVGSNRAGAFDFYSVAFPSIFRENDKFFLYYAGSSDKNWTHSSIGVAWSKDGLNFTREGNEILVNQSVSDFASEAVTPAVARVGSNYFMVFAGRKHRYDRRVLGIAYSDDPKGPFSIIKTIHKPTQSWEGFSIDNGTTVVKEEEDILTVYYSNCAPSIYHFLLNRPLIRRIGTLRIKIRGAGKDSIETFLPKTNPITRLNGDVGKWNESVFCPGYSSLPDNDKNSRCLFYAASRYSAKPQYQSIGYVVVDSPQIIHVMNKPTRLVDHNTLGLKANLPLAFDSPCPIVTEDSRVYLFYSIMDRNAGKWEILRNTLESSDASF